MSQYSNYFLQCDYCFSKTNSPKVHPVVSLYVQIFDRCVIKTLVIGLVTCRVSGILFSGYKTSQEKQFLLVRVSIGVCFNHYFSHPYLNVEVRCVLLVGPVCWKASSNLAVL